MVVEPGTNEAAEKLAALHESHEDNVLPFSKAPRT